MNYEKLQQEHIKREELRLESNLLKHEDSITSFKNLFEKTLPNSEKIQYEYHDATGVIASYPNILFYLNPNLNLDKEGLFSWRTLNQQYIKKHYIPGFLYHESYMVMPSRYFRRGYNQYANYSPSLTRLLWQNDFDQIDFSIALDPNMVRVNVDDTILMELDTWYGPKFQKDISSMKNGLSKLKPPSNLNEFALGFFFANNYSLDVKCSSYSSIIEFEIEEVKIEKVRIEIKGKSYYPARYVHAEYDITAESFRHFDGAIHLYSEEEYLLRKDSDMNFNNKIGKHIKANSNKIFKLNGLISKETFIDYTGNFMTGNPLIHEYFEGKLPEGLTEKLRIIRKARC